MTKSFLLISITGNANFSGGGFVIFQLESNNTPVVRVSGCANFGGSITVDADTSLFRNGLSNITLMEFNCSTGQFSKLALNSQFCSQNLKYLSHSLVLDVSVDCHGNESTVSYIWILLTLLIVLVVAIIIGLVIHFFVKPKKNVDSTIDDMASSDDVPYERV